MAGKIRIRKSIRSSTFQHSYSLKTAVNKRVKHVDVAQGKETGWEHVEFTI